MPFDTLACHPSLCLAETAHRVPCSWCAQIAFVVILVICLLFDATVESGVRALVTGSDFGVSWDAILKKR